MCAEGGLMGAQTCNATGSGYSTCGPCTTARCGDGTCNAMETCSSCAADCGTCMARCGDATCNGTETCSSCAADCGACVATPRCGDGTCNGSETCSTCSDDCGVCAPRCGDGSCNGSETCTTCGADCGVCETMCMACAQDVDCPSGFRCGQRRCDGARSCYSATVTSCAVVGGVRCPPTSAYNLCTSDAAAMPSECGAFAVCMAYGDGRRFCSRRCTTNLDCPTPPTGSTTVPVCDTNTSRCYLRCDAPGACPYGLSCFRYANGTYGYCS
ncbi:MAG: hypothetical protein Q8S73_21495 [Deltaproteobacteria bacterium]|nr:hypothetical protein [Myxococcales bacterium]MDP3216700.1 hypothetical protein [Deltaproteobacteria bacterium]